MSQLIPFEPRMIGTEALETVNARDLHAFLESKQEFSNWIKHRIQQYGFVELLDFMRLTELSNIPGRPVQEYFVTLDMAKELAMVERTAKGKEARQYFIACEQQLKALAPALPPPRTEEQDLAFIDQSLTLLERLQAVDGRDRLFFADQVRNVTRRALAPPTLPATQSLPAVPQPHGASVSDRLYVVAPRLSEKMHRTASIAAGKRCAAEYRTRYGMDPQKFQQFIDGATRPVSWFAPGDWSWVDTICQTVAAGMAPAVQP